jgi:hypothetical protein
MGSFIDIFGDVKPLHTPNETLNRKMERLLYLGGMFNLSYTIVFGIKVITIKRVTIEDSEDGYLSASYNYFEDDHWESMGYNLNTGEVYSNKLGWKSFARATASAYVLESQYSDNPFAVLYNDNVVSKKQYVAWLNYIFKEDKATETYGIWHAYDDMHSRGSKELETYYLEQYLKPNAVDEWLYVHCVETSIAETMAKAEAEDSGGVDDSKILSGILEGVHKYRLEHPEGGEYLADSVIQTCTDAIDLEYRSMDVEYQRVYLFTEALNLYPFTLKAIAEEFGLDFWQLWGKVRDDYYAKVLHDAKVSTISTTDFFNVSPDDMLLYWTEGCDLKLSQGCTEWIGQLKARYESIVDNPKRYTLKDMLTILKTLDSEYNGVYAFDSFLTESIENLSNVKYLALWQLLEEMLLASESTNRETLRRYMAICGNPNLRMATFGV